MKNEDSKSQADLIQPISNDNIANTKNERVLKPAKDDSNANKRDETDREPNREDDVLDHLLYTDI